MNNLDERINRLKQSPLFYLFLSSKELFHSNFWYWLSELNPIEKAELFASIGDNQDVFFKREVNKKNGEFKSKSDLVIYANDSPIIVIENKVKDFPTESQLIRIMKSFDNDSISSFVLATLFWNEDIKFDGWKILTYRNIANNIKPNSFSNCSYYLALIEDYKSFLINLSDLTDSLPITKKYDFTISSQRSLYSKLNDIKLWEGYQKLRASHLLYNYCKPFDIIEVSYGINNKNATIDFKYTLKDDYKIGIQIQGYQFRNYIEGEKHKEFADNLREENCFFDSNWVSPRKKTLLKYAPNFKYQYKKIEDNIDFNTLFNNINENLIWINSNKELIEQKIPGR